MDYDEVWISEYYSLTTNYIQLQVQSRLLRKDKTIIFFMAHWVRNSSSQLFATSSPSPFIQEWDKMIRSGDAGDRKLQLRGQDRGKDEPLRQCRKQQQSGRWFSFNSWAQENPEHLGAQRPRLGWNKRPRPVHFSLSAVKHSCRRSKIHCQLQCQVKPG